MEESHDKQNEDYSNLQYLGARQVELEAVSQRLDGLLLLYHDIESHCLIMRLSDGTNSYSSSLEPSQIKMTTTTTKSKKTNDNDNNDDDNNNIIQQMANYFLSNEIPNIRVTYDIKVNHESIHVSIRKRKGEVTTFLLKPHAMKRDTDTNNNNKSSLWNKIIFYTLQQQNNEMIEMKQLCNESQSKLIKWKETADRLSTSKLESEKEHVTNQFFQLYLKTYNKLKETTEELKILKQQQDSLYHGSTTKKKNIPGIAAASATTTTTTTRGKRKRKTKVVDDDPPQDESLLDSAIVDRLAGDLEEPVSIDSQIVLSPPKSSGGGGKKIKKQKMSQEATEDGDEKEDGTAAAAAADHVPSSSSQQSSSSQPRHNPLTGVMEVHEASQVFDTSLDTTTAAQKNDKGEKESSKIPATDPVLSSSSAAALSSDKTDTPKKKKKKEGGSSQEDKAKMLALLADW